MLITQWLWGELSRKSGFLRVEKIKNIIVAAPKLTPSGKGFLLRILSYWDTDIYLSEDTKTNDLLKPHGKNLWVAPLSNLLDKRKKDDIENSLKDMDIDAPVSYYLFPLSGYAHASMRTYILEEGQTYSRFHSHTAREEHYIVLSGKGKARIADKYRDVIEGDIIFKPTGPDISTQLIGGKGGMKILDIEIWNSPSRNDKDVISYPDHKELYFTGPGWFDTISFDSLMDASDSIDNYGRAYIRKSDGSWEPANFPGFSKRK